MDHTTKVTIPYEAGLSRPAMLLKVQRAMTDEAKRKGWRGGGYHPDRSASDLVDALMRNQKKQTVVLTKTRSGITARRVRASPSVQIADASGALDLEAAARKFTPELTGFALSQMADKLGARKVALDTAIYGSPGLDRSLRLSAISGAGNDNAISKVIGYEPNRGSRIDSMAAGKLKALIQKVMLDLNVDEGDTRTENAQKLLERSFRTKFTLLEQDLVDEFRLMIKGHHEVRLMNLPYIESMMVGMDGAEFPDALLSMLVPSPDDFLKGTDAMLIIDSKNRPEERTSKMSTITDAILDLWGRILNTRSKDKPVLNTDKQKEVASLLEAFNNDRTKMVRAIETSCRKARRRGGDFIDAFTPYPLRAVGPIPGGEKKYAEDLKDLVTKAADNAIVEEGPLYQLDFGNNDEKAEQIFQEMESKGLANRIGDTEYFVVPMSMPRFSTKPIGWDRRWMVATMRIVDEYWNILYSVNGMFITDLLYLISSRAYELFNYTMDAEDLYLLTLLLVGEDGVADGEATIEEIEAVEAIVEAAEEIADDDDEVLPANPELAGMFDEEAKDEDSNFQEEAFDADISADPLADVPVETEEEDDEDKLGGMNTGSRRARRKFASGILPKSNNRGKRLKTIGDMLGVSGVAKGLNKEITELERKLLNRNEDFERQKRKMESAQRLYADTKKAYNKSLELSKELQADKVAFETKRADLEQQLEEMTSFRNAAQFNKAQREKELQALLSEQRGEIGTLSSTLGDLTSTLGKRDKRIEGLKTVLQRKNLDLAFQGKSYDDLFASSGTEIARMGSMLKDRQNLISILREGLEEERVAMNELSTKTTEQINDLNEALANKEITTKEFKKQINKLESDYEKELKRTESLTAKVDEKAEQLLAVEKKLVLAGEESTALTGQLSALESDYLTDMGALRSSQTKEVSELASLLLASEEETAMSQAQLAALDAQTTEELETLMEEISELERAQIKALADQQAEITGQANEQIDEYVAELERVKEEKRKEIKSMQLSVALAENKLRTSRGPGALALKERIDELEEQLSQKLMAIPQSQMRASDVRDLTAPVSLNRDDVVALIEGTEKRDTLNALAKLYFNIDNPESFPNKKALKSEMYKQFRKSQGIMRQITGGRRARRKARSTKEIKITRADGTGKDLGLVTAEVMVGVNIISDIKTGIRDVFGGRSKSGQVKLQDAMNILIEELKTRASAMGATSISHFHAEPFVYGGSGSIIGLYGYGVARKGGKVKANPPKKSSPILPIYAGTPDNVKRNEGAIFSEVQIGRNIVKDVGEVVQSVYRGLIGGRTSMAEKRMAMAIATMQKELSDRAMEKNANAVGNLKIDYEIIQGSATITIMAHADAFVVEGISVMGRTARRKGKRKARSAELVELGLATLTGVPATLFAQRLKAWWQRRKGTLPATQKDLGSLTRQQDLEGIASKEDVDNLKDAFQTMIESLAQSDAPQLAATTVAAEIEKTIPAEELEKAYEILDIDAPEIAEEVEDLTQNLEDTRPFLYWTPFGFVTIEVPSMVFTGNEFALHYFELYTGENPSVGNDHIEVIHENQRFVFPRNGEGLSIALKGVVDTFGNDAAIDATEDGKYEDVLLRFAQAYDFNPFDPDETQRTIMPASEYDNPPSKGMNADKAFEILGKTRYAWILKRQDMDFTMKQLTSETPYLMYGSNGFWATNDDNLEGLDEDITDVSSYIQHYGSSGEVAVYNKNTDEWFPLGLPVTKNPPSERKYKGMIIKKSGKMWNVEAFDKDFKTLQGARDFISKKVSGAASANGPCPRVIGKTKCKGTVILVRNKWKCKACKAEFREA